MQLRATQLPLSCTIFRENLKKVRQKGRSKGRMSKYTHSVKGKLSMKEINLCRVIECPFYKKVNDEKTRLVTGSSCGRYLLSCACHLLKRSYSFPGLTSDQNQSWIIFDSDKTSLHLVKSVVKKANLTFLAQDQIAQAKLSKQNTQLESASLRKKK